FLCLHTRRPSLPSLFPYTTLFRSQALLPRENPVSVYCRARTVPFFSHGKSSKFRQNGSPLFLRLHFQPEEIVVGTPHIPASLVEPAAGRIYQTGRIQTFQFLCKPFCIKLSPSFVKQRPKDDGRMPIECAYCLSHLMFKLCPAFFTLSGQKPSYLVRDRNVPDTHGSRPVSHIPVMVRFSSVNHILPHQHSQTVAVIVPALWLDFAVLPEHVIAEIFRLTDIKNHRLIGRRCIKPVRPVPLIQKSSLEQNLVVQADPWNAFRILFHRDATHRKVAFHLVFSHPYFKLIQIWIPRCPAPLFP